MSEKLIDIKERFDIELSEISYILTNLENGRVYELSEVKGDGSLAHNVAKLRKELNSLLVKIQYNKDSISEELAAVFFPNDNK